MRLTPPRGRDEWLVGAGLALAAAGLTRAFELLTSASGHVSGTLTQEQRLVLDLWHVRLLGLGWLGAGLLAVWLGARGDGERVAAWRSRIARPLAGVAGACAALAVIVALGSLAVAINGSYHHDGIEVAISSTTRLATLAAQLVSAAAALALFGALAVALARVGDRPAVPVEQLEPAAPVADVPPAPPAPVAGPVPTLVQPMLAPVVPEHPPVARPRRAPTLLSQVEAAFRDRHAFSPRREEALDLVARVRSALEAGDEAGAHDLARQLDSLDGGSGADH